MYVWGKRVKSLKLTVIRERDEAGGKEPLVLRWQMYTEREGGEKLDE